MGGEYRRVNRKDKIMYSKIIIFEVVSICLGKYTHIIFVRPPLDVTKQQNVVDLFFFFSFRALIWQYSPRAENDLRIILRSV